MPGLIDQHLHPILGAAALATEVIATEEWELPGRTVEAANSHDEYVIRLRSAERLLDDPDEWLFSWGYHALWYGEMSRQILDPITGPSSCSSRTRLKTKSIGSPDWARW